MLVNIIIPIKNTSIGYFEDCLYSLMTQIDKNFIVTVIDDGSYIENTQQYINLLNQMNFHKNFYRSEVSIGPGPARQYCMDKDTASDYFFFLDSDDLLFPNAIRVLSHEYNKDNNLEIIAGKLFGGAESPEWERPREECENGGRVTGILYKKNFLKRYNIRFLDKKMTGAEDSYFSLVTSNLVMHSKYIETPIYYYRYNPYSISKNKNYDYSFEINVDHAYSQYMGSKKVMEFFPTWNFGGLLAVLFNNYQYAFIRNAEDQMEEIEKMAIDFLQNDYVKNNLDKAEIMEWVEKYKESLKKDNETPQTFMEWRKEIEEKAYGN